MSGQWQPNRGGPEGAWDAEAALLDPPAVLSAQDVVDRAAYRKARRRELAVVLGAAVVAGSGIVAILWTVLHNVVAP